MLIEISLARPDNVPMNQQLSIQKSLRKLVRRHGPFSVLLMLLVSAVSIIGRPQEPVTHLSKEQGAMNPAWRVARMGVSRHPGQLVPVSSANADPVAILSSAGVIYVRSTALLVGASTVEEKLRGRPEFQQLRLLITRDEANADLILELRHDVLTKYVYSAIDPKTQIVVASGKVSSLGGTVAGKVAKRFLKQVTVARAQAGS